MSENLCGLCGEPMPEGEKMFKYHGYSGPCPKPPKQKAELSGSPRPPQESALSLNEAAKLFRKIEACSSLSAKLILLRDFCDKYAAELRESKAPLSQNWMKEAARRIWCLQAGEDDAFVPEDGSVEHGEQLLIENILQEEAPHFRGLPFRVWCECGHISGQHGAQFPHRCACDGNRWIDGHGSICDCQGFKSPALEALTEFLTLLEEIARLEHDCDPPEFTRCDLCEDELGLQHRRRSLLDLWADQWAMILRDQLRETNFRGLETSPSQDSYNAAYQFMHSWLIARNPKYANHKLTVRMRRNRLAELLSEYKSSAGVSPDAAKVERTRAVATTAHKSVEYPQSNLAKSEIQGGLETSSGTSFQNLVSAIEEMIENGGLSELGSDASRESNKILARAWLRKERQKVGSNYINEELVLLLAKFLSDYEAILTLSLAVEGHEVEGLIAAAGKLLEWMPIYSKGSSGHIRQTKLRTAIDKFRLADSDAPRVSQLGNCDYPHRNLSFRGVPHEKFKKCTNWEPVEESSPQVAPEEE